MLSQNGKENFLSNYFWENEDLKNKNNVKLQYQEEFLCVAIHCWTKEQHYISLDDTADKPVMIVSFH